MYSLEQIRLAMASTNDIFNREVFGKRNFNALDEVYTVQSRILPPGGPAISGRAEIKQFWANFIQSANASAAVLTPLDVMEAGDDVVEIGKAVLTVSPDGASTAEVEVKYVVYWKQEDGRWKWHVDIWNTNA